MRNLLAFLLFCISLSPAAAQQQIAEDRFPSQSLIEEFQTSLGATASAAARDISSIALAIIKTFEGWYPSAYNDPVGYCTIGYGHLIALSRCETIDLRGFGAALSVQDGEALLIKDTLGARLAVQELVSVELDDDQFGALVSFTFNVGKGNFARSSLLRFINDKQHELIPGEFARWVKAKGRILPGLVTRRSCEALLFQGGVQIAAGQRFDPSICRGAGAAPGIGDLIDIEIGE